MLISRWAVLFAVAALTPVEGWPWSCRSSLDCQLNGNCVDGKCVCDEGWHGDRCGALTLGNASRMGGYHNQSFGVGDSWGGNAVLGPEGLWHLFVAEMVNNCSLGDYGGASSIIHATSSTPGGPYSYRETVVEPFAHNPTVRILPDGSVAIWFIGSGDRANPKDCRTAVATTKGKARPAGPQQLTATGGATAGGCGGISVATAPTLDGPWKITPLFVENCAESHWLNCSFTNPSPHILPNGTVLLALQAGYCHTELGFHQELLGIARAEGVLGPYKLITGDPLVADKPWCLAGMAEDPFLWRNAHGFHIIAHGMCYSLFDAIHLYSLDAVNWFQSPRKDVYPYTVAFDDGSKETFSRVERPQLIFNENLGPQAQQHPLFLVNGVCAKAACLKSPRNTWTLIRPIV